MSDTPRLIDRLLAGGIVSAFKHRNFAIYTLAAWCSDNAMWLMRVGMGWLTWDLTHDGFWLGAVVMAQAIPSAFLVPITGAITDRTDRVAMLRNTQILSVALAWTLSSLVFADLVNIYVLLVYAFTHGSVATFATPARVTLGPNLVPRSDVTAAIACSSVLFGIATFLGPAIAGILITSFHIGLTFFFFGFGNVILVIALTFFVHIERDERHARQSSILDDVVESVRYVRGHDGILPVMILSTFGALLIRPIQDLMPGFADTVFMTGASGFATFMASYGIGGMLSGLWLANRNRLEGTSTIFLRLSLAAAVFITLFSSTNNPVLGVLAMTALGMTFSVANNAGQILIQNAVAGSMRARVMSLYSYNYRMVPSIGAMIIGWSANAFGFQVPMAAAGLLAFLAGVWTWQRRAIIRDHLEGVAYEEAPAQ